MALSKLTTDMKIISALATEPNDVGGLTDNELKAKFDEAPNAIKTYINDTLTAEIDAQKATKAEVQGLVLGQIPDGTITKEKLNSATLGELLGDSHKNLLLNWDFRNPVNRNGVSSIPADSYGIDRWQFVSGGATVNNGYVTPAVGAILTQTMESAVFAKIVGKTVTLSVELDTGVIYSGSCIPSASSTSVAFDNAYIQAYTFTAGVQFYIKQIVNITRVKFELGSTSTLANDAPAIYAEEYAKCVLYDQSTGTFIGLDHPGRWVFLQAYEGSGTSNWSAPDIYGNGRPYELGVFMIGGGQSGEAVLQTNNSSYLDSVGARGGYSGEPKSFITNVTPGQAIPIVVGAGGVSTPLTGSYWDRNKHSATQGNGGTTSFNGTVALGGGCGIYGVPVGQPSDSIGVSNYSGDYIATVQAPVCGQPYKTITLGSSFSNQTPCPYSRVTDFICPFEIATSRGGAGGAAQADRYPGSSRGTIIQTCPVMSDGRKAGDGYAQAILSGTFSGSLEGHAATSPGSGGGAVAVNASEGSNVNIRGGNGAPGCIYLFVRKR